MLLKGSSILAFAPEFQHLILVSASIIMVLAAPNLAVMLAQIRADNAARAAVDSSASSDDDDDDVKVLNVAIDGDDLDAA